MIIAAGLTPAWQQVLVFDELRIGDVNRASEVHWIASGKVTNVGVALYTLGGPCLTLGVSGGAAGRSLEAELEGRGMACRWIPSRSPTRICTTLLDRATGATTELVENAAPIEPDVIESCAVAYAEACAEAGWVVLTGSLPAGAPRSFYRDLLTRTPADTRVILDARGPELIAALEGRPFLVKPNRAELGLTVGRELETDEDVEGAIREVHDRGAECVLITDGTRPAWLSDGDDVWRITPASVATVNPIACGDCLAAGFAWGLRRGFDLVDAGRCGMAAAAENAAVVLPSRLDPQRVLARMTDVRVVG